MLNKSKIFKAAHKLTRATILRSKGDSYSATFAICLKITIAIAKKDAMMQGEYKNLGDSWGAFVKGVYNSKTKTVSRPAIGEKVCITTKGGERQVRVVTAIVKEYASGTVVSLSNDALVAQQAQERYNAKKQATVAKTVKTVSKAKAYDDLYNEGGEGFNPYRNY